MRRRDLLQRLGAALGGGAILSVWVARAFAQATLASEDLSVTAKAVWEAWTQAYLQPDGRVVDRLQRQASHSEGQGYGMILAVEFADHDAFRRMFAWTEANLAIRPDPLLAWRWLPDQALPVPDLNNATDGDLFYAWALVRAARRFGEPRYLERASETAFALVQHCVRPSPAQDGTLLLLPGAYGFVRDDRVVINPSYLMPLALRELAAATGVVELSLVAEHGLQLLTRLAEAGLVPDWVEVSPRGLGPADGFGANAGYEAMRVPLYLIWSGAIRHPAVQQMARVYARTVQPGAPVPTVIEPHSGVVLEYSPDPGYQALAGLVACAGTPGQLGAAIPPLDPTQPYYPATLQMLAMLATTAAVPQCVPL